MFSLNEQWMFVALSILGLVIYSFTQGAYTFAFVFQFFL